MSKLEDLEQKYKELGEEIERLKKEEKNKKWIPKAGESFWYLTKTMNPTRVSHTNTPYSNTILKYNKVFKTEEEAEEYRDYLIAREEARYEFSEEEWKNRDIEKWLIVYCASDKSIYASWHRDMYAGALDFRTRKDAQNFIDKYKKQILKYEFGIEEEEKC